MQVFAGGGRESQTVVKQPVMDKGSLQWLTD